MEHMGLDYEETRRRMEEFKQGGFKRRRLSGKITCRDCGKQERLPDFVVSPYCGECAKNHKHDK